MSGTTLAKPATTGRRIRARRSFIVIWGGRVRGKGGEGGKVSGRGVGRLMRWTTEGED